MAGAPDTALRRLQVRPRAWTLVGRVLPAAAFTIAATLLLRNLGAHGAATAPSAVVDPDHAARLAANISFFEQRAAEMHDSISYNRLAALYLQRVRETGDVADLRRADLSATRSLEVGPDEYAGLMALAQVRLAQHDFEEA